MKAATLKRVAHRSFANLYKHKICKKYVKSLFY